MKNSKPKLCDEDDDSEVDAVGRIDEEVKGLEWEIVQADRVVDGSGYSSASPDPSTKIFLLGPRTSSTTNSGEEMLFASGRIPIPVAGIIASGFLVSSSPPPNSIQNTLPDPAPLPQTPKMKQANGPPEVEGTPMSQKCTSHAEDEVPQRASVVNKFLEDDIGDGVVFSLDDFATLILELPVDWKVKEDIALQLDSQAVKDAFEAYLSVAMGVAEAEGKKRKGAAGHETQLYRPLANLLNVLKDSDGEEGRVERDIDEKIFYVQDPRPVLGSRIERKPDLGGIYLQLLELTEDEGLSDYLEKKKKIVGVFWGLLLYFVEVKHRKGNFIGMSIRKAEGTKTPRNGSSQSAVAKGSRRGSRQGSRTTAGPSLSIICHALATTRPVPVITTRCHTSYPPPVCPPHLPKYFQTPPQVFLMPLPKRPSSRHAYESPLADNPFKY
ncbi:hypothetical protein C8J55DRAFT_559943 [Lentinula edodes]|uniref:Uncharacterized protein n=1 Tax=Lentinula lateritia TaxID=40482 RepID=A0A9W9AF11_9AGAR|nr:hypothetical protein C8J55DRAFT_559943 [Lentinula edodes]